MIHWFLKAKHWQIFLGYAGIFLLTMILLFSSIFSIILSVDRISEGPENFLFPFWIFLPMVLLMVYDLLYHWNVGGKLHSLIPKPGKFKISYLYWSLAFPVIFIFLIFVGVAIFAITITPEIDNPRPFLTGMIILIPLQLLAMLCQFYRIYFMARAVKSVELGRLARFDECIVECILFWFWIVGIWIIQPRINELYDKSLRNTLPEEE